MTGNSSTATKIASITNSDIVQLAATQTLTNKSLTSHTITGTGSIAGTFSGDLTGDVTGNVSGSSGSCTGNAATATKIASITNSDIVQLTDTQTLTNKSLTSPTITGTGSIAGTFTGDLTGDVTGNVSGSSGSCTGNAATATKIASITNSDIVQLTATQTLTNKTLTSPTITGNGSIAGTFTGDLTGNVTGDVTGDLTGDVTGNVSGSSGSCTGNAATATKIASITNSDIVQLTDTQTLTNKSLTSPTITGTGSIAGTFTGDLTGDVSGNVSGSYGSCTGNAATATKIASITNSDIVQLTATQTLTNKSLTSPTITGTGAIAGTFTGDLTGNVTGDLTGNAATATKIGSITNSDIVQLAATQTLTNKSLTSPTITGTGAIAGTFTGDLTGDVTGNVTGSSGSCTGNAATATKIASITNSDIVQLAATQTLTNKSLTSPTITGTGAIAGTFTGDLTGNVTGTVSSLSNHDTDDLAEGTNKFYSDTLSRAALSISNASGDGSIAYNNSSGVITYTGPSDSEVRAHFSGGNGISITDGSVAVDSTADVTFNDLTVSGNLTINGTSTNIDTTNLVVEDPLIKLAKNNDSSDALDIGIYGLYDVSGTDKYSGIFRDSSDSGKWKIFKDLTSEPGTTVDTTDSSFSKGVLVSDIEGDVTGNASTATKIASITNSDIVQLTATQTLTNKSLTSPTITGTGATQEHSTGDLTGDVTGNVSGSSGSCTGNTPATATKIASITNSNIVQLAETQTLTNKSLTSPTITGTGSIAGTFTGDLTGDVTGNVSGSSGSCTGNAATATKIASITNSDIVQLTETQTLTNKSLTSPTITGTGSIAGTFTGDLTGDVTGNVSGSSGSCTGNAATATKIASITNSDIVQLTATQTLTNKSLTSPTITGTGSIAGTFTGDLTGDVTGNVSGSSGSCTGNAATATKIASITNSDIVQLTETQTLTNKSLTSPTITGTGSIAGTFTGDLTGDVSGNASTATKIASITNSDIVQLTATQTLTNKSLTSPTITGTGSIAGTFTGDLTGDVTGNVSGSSGSCTGNAATATKIASITNSDIVQLTATQTLTNKSLTSPTITGTGSIAGTFTGDLTGDVTGNVSGSSGSCTGNAATATKIASITNSNIVQLTETQTLTNKSLTSPTITGTGAIAGTFTGDLTGDAGNVSGSSGSCTGNAATATKIASITNSDIVQLTATQTLTNKSLTSPTITGTGAIAGTFTGDLTGDVTGNVSGSSGSCTGNAATATKIASITNSNIVQLTETQTLTNKSLTSPTITGTGAIAGTFTGDLTGDVTGNVSGSSGSCTGNAATATKIASITNSDIVQLAATQTLTNKSLTSPTITGTGAIAGTFTGDLTGDVTGNVSGSSGSCTGNAATATKIASITNSDIVQLTATQTLTNKSLTSPTITGTGAIAGTFTGNLTGNVTGTVSSLSNHDTDDLSEGTNKFYSDTLSRAALSISNASGDGSIAYNNSSGVITYTGPSDSEVRAHFSGGNGISITDGSVAVDSTADVTFNDLTVQAI